MERRKWEDMNMDCLVNIFGRVGLIETLALDVPFVCKSWYKATLNPRCWQSLKFSQHCLGNLRFPHKKLSGFGLWSYVSHKLNEDVIKGAINRTQGCAIHLTLPFNLTWKELIYVSDKCPLLKSLSLPCSKALHFVLPSIISKWKNLEALELIDVSKYLKETIVQISLHCSNFVRLGVTYSTIDGDAAYALVTLLPNLQHLDLTASALKRDDLVMILEGCKQLDYLNLNHCKGFDRDDKGLLMLGCCATTFIYEKDKYDDDSSVAEITESDDDSNTDEVTESDDDSNIYG